MKKLHYNFVQIDHDKKLLKAFNNESGLERYYSQSTLKDVDIIIDDNGVLSIECKEFVYMYDVSFYYSTESEYWTTEKPIELYGPFGTSEKFKLEELDKSKTKQITITKWEWFWLGSQFKKACDIEHYIGLQVKYVKNAIKISYHGWELREYN